MRKQSFDKPTTSQNIMTTIATNVSFKSPIRVFSECSFCASYFTMSIRPFLFKVDIIA